MKSFLKTRSTGILLNFLLRALGNAKIDQRGPGELMQIRMCGYGKKIKKRPLAAVIIPPVGVKPGTGRGRWTPNRTVVL